MPASIKLQQEYGDDLAIIFVEAQGTTKTNTEKFIMGRRWLGNQAMWTNERPLRLNTRGLPSFALLSAEGVVLATGNHMTSQDKDLIEEEVDKAKSAPESSHKSFKKAWKDFNKGKYAKAIADASKVGVKKAELAAEAQATVSTFKERIQGKLNRATWLMDNGYPVASKKMLGDLASGLKGSDDLLATVRELETRLESDEMKLELKAAEKINRHLTKLYEDGKDPKLFAKLEKMADEFSGTKVAERARAMAALGG